MDNIVGFQRLGLKWTKILLFGVTCAKLSFYLRYIQFRTGIMRPEMRDGCKKQMCYKTGKSGAALTGIPCLLSVQIKIFMCSYAWFWLFWWIYFLSHFAYIEKKSSRSKSSNTISDRLKICFVRLIGSD